MTRQLIIALTVAFVSVTEARAQSGYVAKVLIALENVWVEALVQADTAKLEAWESPITHEDSELMRIVSGRSVGEK